VKKRLAHQKLSNFCLVGELRSGNLTIFDVLILPVSINYELTLSRTHLPLWFAAGLSWMLVHENEKGGFSFSLVLFICYCADDGFKISRDVRDGRLMYCLFCNFNI